MSDNDYLLNDKQVAMDAVLVACRVATERCAECADILGETSSLARQLRRCAQQHRASADALRDIIGRSDHLPQGENDEKQWLASLGVQLRAMVSPEREARVIEACLASETDLLDSIRTLSAFSLYPSLESCLKDLREHASQAVDALRAASDGGH